MREGPYGLAAVAIGRPGRLYALDREDDRHSTDGHRCDHPRRRHVDFEPGATVMVLAGTLGAGQAARYVLGAHEGDLLMAHVLSPGEDLRVSVQRLDEETPVPDAVETESYWAGRLPATSGYLVEVHGAGEEGPFHLELEIPRHLPLTPGVSSVALDGTIQPHAPLAFVARIEEGRTLERLGGVRGRRGQAHRSRCARRAGARGLGGGDQPLPRRDPSHPGLRVPPGPGSRARRLRAERGRRVADDRERD